MALVPFVQSMGGIVNVPIKELSMIGIIQDLTDGRAGAFWHHAINHAFAFGHPGSRKSHFVMLRRFVGVLYAKFYVNENCYSILGQSSVGCHNQITITPK